MRVSNLNLHRILQSDLFVCLSYDQLPTEDGLKIHRSYSFPDEAAGLLAYAAGNLPVLMRRHNNYALCHDSEARGPGQRQLAEAR